VLGDFKTAEWLLWQATLSYRLLVPLFVVFVWSLWALRKERRALHIFFLPACWLLPVVLAGAFTDWTSPIMKTASWIGVVGLAALVFQIGWSLFAIVRMKGLRWLAIAGVTANVLVALPTLFVVVMDASGDWV
jgi:hypothetical protein